jgi:hypothetical protein
MIKSDFGTVEVTGFKPVVMAEFVSLLEVLKHELGKEDYNRILQDADNTKKSGDEPEEKEVDFEPHLVPPDGTVDYGRIGEETNICDITGENLSVGDTVNLYAIEDNGQVSFRGEHSIVKYDNSEFVMGVSGSKFNRGFSNNNFEWLIILNRRHKEIKDGETVDCIKYIKSERAGK